MLKVLDTKPKYWIKIIYIKNAWNYKESFDDIYKALSKEHNLTLMPFLLEGVVLNPKLNIEDGKHPNAEGVKIIAKNLAPYILKEIKK